MSARHDALHEERHERELDALLFLDRAPCSRSRSALTAVMSISLNVVRCAVACCDSSKMLGDALAARRHLFARLALPVGPRLRPRRRSRCGWQTGEPRRSAAADSPARWPARSRPPCSRRRRARFPGPSRARRPRSAAARSAEGATRTSATLVVGCAGCAGGWCRRSCAARLALKRRLGPSRPVLEQRRSRRRAGLVDLGRAGRRPSRRRPPLGRAWSARRRHRRHFDRDLVRLELDDRVAWGDRVALLLQPARHRRFDDRFTERRDFDGRHSSDPKSR